MNNIQELYDKRLKIVEDQRALLDKVGEEKREITSEEETEYENMSKEYDSLSEQIETEEKKEEERKQREDELSRREEYLKSAKKPAIKPEIDPGPENRTELPSLDYIDSDYRRAAELRIAIEGWRKETRGIYAGEAYRDAYRGYLIDGKATEVRALQADIGQVGGYLVTPEQFIAKLVMKLDNILFFRQMATVFSLPKADSIGAAALEDDPADPVWTKEIAAGDEDTTMKFDKRSLTPIPLAKYIKVSKELLRVATIDVEGLVRDRLAYKFATVEENCFLNGNGAEEPLGVFTAIAAGISTGRDVSAANTTTAIRADNLHNCLMKLKAQYRTPAVWVFHRDAIKQIRKLKTGEGDYIWQPGIASDKPETILGKRYFESEYAPNTFESGKYVGILGNFGQYWIADALDMTIEVATELYIATNQNGYFARKKTDGMPVDENAFVRVTLA